MRIAFALLSAAGWILTSAAAQEIARVLPPPGIAISAEAEAKLKDELAQLDVQFRALPDSPANADAEVFLKAVRYALENGEFFHANDAKAAGELLAEAGRRIAALQSGERPWLSAPGLVVRGYYSEIDGSAQPFGLVVADDAPDDRAPAWIWLHGRGDKETDLRFLASRLRSRGEFRPPGTVVVHPFGRYCNGFKGAGERDVLDVADALVREGRIDPQRIALAGFSMGGAGAWMVGAHFTDRWKVVHAGAGFVDVRRYRGMSDADVAALPPWERTLWGQNDVPAFARNLLRVPLVAYSGEIDRQRAAAEIMAESLAAHGRILTHIIGPGTGHKYHEEAHDVVEEYIQSALLAPESFPREVSLQTRTLRYSRMHWIEALGLGEHWQDARIDAEMDAPPPDTKTIRIATANVTALRLATRRGPPLPDGIAIRIDGRELHAAGGEIVLTKSADGWRIAPPPDGLRKSPGLQGPIDDAFNGPFLTVLPDRDCADPAVDRWVKAESAHQRDRWRRLMRGDTRVRMASEVTADDVRRYHLVLWGDEASNPWIAKVLPSLPVTWNADEIAVGAARTPAAGHLPALVFPNPLQPDRYVVLNSGLTFREEHDRTNSLQNPHLPDWAIVDLSVPPDGASPGRIAAAGFFDENWRPK